MRYILKKGNTLNKKQWVIYYKYEENLKGENMPYDIYSTKKQAIKELNRLLTQPIPSSGEKDSGEQAGDTGEDTGGGADTEMEPEEEEEEPV